MSPQPGRRSEKWLLTVNTVLPAAGDMLQESGPTALSQRSPFLKALERGRYFIFPLQLRTKEPRNKEAGITVCRQHFTDFVRGMRRHPLKEGGNGIPLIQERSGVTIPSYQHLAPTLHPEQHPSKTRLELDLPCSSDGSQPGKAFWCHLELL